MTAPTTSTPDAPLEPVTPDELHIAAKYLATRSIGPDAAATVAKLLHGAADELEARRDAWADLHERLLNAQTAIVEIAGDAPDDAARLAGKHEGIAVALDYMRGYEQTMHPSATSAQ